MNSEISKKILLKYMKNNKICSLTVQGKSMEPILYTGDIVNVESSDDYVIGDIVVFEYKNELLIHRLLKIDNGIYYCKGDNAFRLENIQKNDIIGKVIIDDLLTFNYSVSCIELSYLVSKQFRYNGYSIELTKKSLLYKFYIQTVYRRNDVSIFYRKNTNLCQLYSVDGLVKLFNKYSGDIYEITSLESEILNHIDGCSFEKLNNYYNNLKVRYSDIALDLYEMLANFFVRNIIDIFEE